MNPEADAIISNIIWLLIFMHDHVSSILCILTNYACSSLVPNMEIRPQKISFLYIYLFWPWCNFGLFHQKKCGEICGNGVSQLLFARSLARTKV